MPPAGDAAEKIPRSILLAFVIFFLLITGAGILYYQSQEQQTNDRITGDLTSIAQLKADQIASWREGRLSDARMISGNPFLVGGIREYINSRDPVGRQEVLTLFDQLNASYKYRNVQLFDRDGRVILSLIPNTTTINPRLLKPLAKAEASGDAVLTDLITDSDGTTPRMYLIAPIPASDNAGSETDGSIVATIYPGDFLYPLIDSWPLPRTSAETLLVEREGDHVLFLNDLRYQDNTALNLTIPLSQTEVPAVKAVLGTTGIFPGRDYRGVNVISVLEPVPGSPWFIVAKQDSDEAFATWRPRALIIIVLVVVILIGVFLITGFIWQRRQKYHYRSLYDLETAQHESETRLPLALVVGNAGIWEWNLENNTVHFDDRFHEMLGYSPGELPATLEGWMSYHNPEDVPVWMGKAEAYLRGDIPIFESEHRIRTKGGEWAWVFTRGQFVNSPAVGPKKLFVGIAMNVTERKRVEEVLHLTHERLQGFIDANVVGFVVATPGGDILETNDYYLHLIGYTREEFEQGRVDWRTLTPPEWLPADEHAIAELREQGKCTPYEKEYLRHDGTRVSVLLTDTMLSGPEELIIAFVLDITDRKRVEAELKESEEKYRKLFENITAGFALYEIILDTAGKPVDYRFLLVNTAFEKITGLNSQEINNRRILEILPGTEPYWIETYGHVALFGEPVMFENFSRDLDKWFEVRAYSPGHGQFATVVTDVTDRKAMESQRESLIRELEQKNAELERFTYTVSHDLKSPLITIKGFAGLLEADTQKGDPVQLKKDIRRIMDAADTMQELLVDLIELSRVGKIINPPQIIPFGTIVHEAVNLLAVLLSERNVTLGIAPDMPLVNVDHTRIREVMVNLIENAVKSLGDRSDPEIRIGVDMTREIPVFFVEDNGIGINPRYLERIFNLFERLDAAAPGTGIGLTIARRIIEIHGGKIWAESEGEGKGTTFRFTLPGVPAGTPVHGPS